MNSPGSERGQRHGQAAVRVLGAELDHGQVREHLQGERELGAVPARAGRRSVGVEKPVDADRASHRVQGGRDAVEFLRGQDRGERGIPDGEHRLGGTAAQHGGKVSVGPARLNGSARLGVARGDDDPPGGDYLPWRQVKRGSGDLGERRLHVLVERQVAGRRGPRVKVTRGAQKRRDPGQAGQVISRGEPHGR